MLGKFRKSSWAGGGLIALLVVACYLPVLQAGFIWDDDAYIIRNKPLREVGGLQRIWLDRHATPQYYPLVHTTFWGEYRLWGLKPLGYHVNNLLLHALATFLLWRLLAKIHPPAAWLAALLFALHPVAVESVAWVTERKNVLSAVFYFAAALAYLRFAPVGEKLAAASGGNPSSAKLSPRVWRWYGVALGLFVCALLSKTVTCSLPAALLLVFWWKRGRITVRDVLQLSPFFAVGLVLAMNTASLEKHHVGAEGPEWQMPFIERFLIAGRALWFYAGKLLWPADLTFIYPRWMISATVWWQWLFPAAVVAVVGILWFARNKIGRGPLVAVLFFAGTLFPALGFFNVYPMRYSFVADHFQYLASVGLLVAAADGLVRVVSRGCYILPLTLGVLTWQQVHIYRDLESLWRDTIRKNPSCWLAYTNLSVVRKAAGDTRETEELCHAALRLKPDSEEALNNLGASLIHRNRYNEAIVQLERGLAVNPDYVPLLVNYGLALQGKGQIEKAMEYYHRALAINPEDAEALISLGTALALQERHVEARAAFEDAIDARPELDTPRIKLGVLFEKLGDQAAAEAQFREVISADPENRSAHVELAKLFAAQGKGKEALDEYNLLERLDPHDATVQCAIGCLLFKQGNIAAAVNRFKRALVLKPNYSEARNNLAWLLATARDAACRNGAEAVRLVESSAQTATNASPEALDTLAAAYAENGQWPQAVQTARSALTLAQSATNQALADDILRRLEHYQINQPWRE